MATDSKSGPASTLKLGAVAVSSAILGGLAAAWWHRRTLTKLQNPILSVDVRDAGSSEESEEDTEFREF